MHLLQSQQVNCLLFFQKRLIKTEIKSNKNNYRKEIKFWKNYDTYNN